MGVIGKVKAAFGMGADEHPYECEDCGAQFESTIGAPALVSCPECGAEEPTKRTDVE